MGALSFDELRAGPPGPARVRRVDLPEYGPEAFTFVRCLSGAEAEEFALAFTEADEDQGRRAKVVAKLTGQSLCDEQGTRLYPAGEEEKVYDLPFPVYDRLREAALDLNGFSKKSEEALQGKPEAPRSTDSGSA